VHDLTLEVYDAGDWGESGIATLYCERRDLELAVIGRLPDRSIELQEDVHLVFTCLAGSQVFDGQCPLRILVCPRCF